MMEVGCRVNNLMDGLVHFHVIRSLRSLKQLKHEQQLHYIFTGNIPNEINEISFHMKTLFLCADLQISITCNVLKQTETRCS